MGQNGSREFKWLQNSEVLSSIQVLMLLGDLHWEFFAFVLMLLVMKKGKRFYSSCEIAQQMKCPNFSQLSPVICPFMQ